MSTLTTGLDAMQTKAESLAIFGVAVIVVHPEADGIDNILFEVRICGQLETDFSSESSNNGENLLALSLGKVALMIRTKTRTGLTKNVKTGECNEVGGEIDWRDNKIAYAAFSGGADSQNLEVAMSGLSAMGFSVD